MAGQTAKNLKVLVVDDEADIAELIALSFEIYGWEVQVARSGNAAMKILSKKNFNIVITDIRMPDGSGLDLIANIRGDHADAPKIFVITGHSEVSFDKIFALGADGLLLKPFSTTLLLETVRKSVLTREVNWQHAPAGHPKFSIEKELSDGGLTVNGELSLGRGGFFLADVGVEAKLHETGTFRLKLKDGLELKGAGRLRWIRTPGMSPGLRSGVGIEILYLEDSCRRKVVSWIEEKLPIPFIPNT